MWERIVDELRRTSLSNSTISFMDVLSRSIGKKKCKILVCYEKRDILKMFAPLVLSEGGAKDSNFCVVAINEKCRGCMNDECKMDVVLEKLTGRKINIVTTGTIVRPSMKETRRVMYAIEELVGYIVESNDDAPFVIYTYTPMVNKIMACMISCLTALLHPFDTYWVTLQSGLYTSELTYKIQDIKTYYKCIELLYDTCRIKPIYRNLPPSTLSFIPADVKSATSMLFILDERVGRGNSHILHKVVWEDRWLKTTIPYVSEEGLKAFYEEVLKAIIRKGSGWVREESILEEAAKNISKDVKLICYANRRHTIKRLNKLEGVIEDVHLLHSEEGDGLVEVIKGGKRIPIADAIEVLMGSHENVVVAFAGIFDEWNRGVEALIKCNKLKQVKSIILIEKENVLNNMVEKVEGYSKGIDRYVVHKGLPIVNTVINGGWYMERGIFYVKDPMNLFVWDVDVVI